MTLRKLIPSHIFVYVNAHEKYIDVSERGYALLKQYVEFSTYKNNEKLCTFGQFARLAGDEIAKEFENEFVKPAVKKWGSDLVDTNGSENPNYWKINFRMFIEKIELAKQKLNEHRKMSYMLDHQDWSVIYNPRVFDVELYFKDKGSQHREEREFPITLEYEHIEAWAEFFNGLVADLKERGKLK